LIAAQPCGIFLAMALSGVIAVDVGWEFIFYIFSGVTLIFSAVWFVFAADGPDVHPYISEEERTYICQSIGVSSDNKCRAFFYFLSFLRSG